MLHHTSISSLSESSTSQVADFSLSAPAQLVLAGLAGPDGRACELASIAPAGPAGGLGSGLVPFSTSGPSPSDAFPIIEVDPLQARLSRMSAGVLTATRLIDAEWTASKIRFNRYMLTLTYRPGELWGARDISDCIKKYRNWADKLGFKLSYVWVAEIQEARYLKGALLGECVHYHLLLWVPVRFGVPKPDKQGWWPHGMTQRLKVTHPVRYMMKYASKGKSVEFPKGLRIHGCGGLVEAARNERRWWLMPRWVRAIFSVEDLPVRVPGGGILSRLTGEWLPSIWEVTLSYGHVFVSLRYDLLDFLSIGRIFLLIESGII